MDVRLERTRNMTFNALSFLQRLSLIFGTHEIDTFSLDTNSRRGIATFHLDTAGKLGGTGLTKQVQCLTGEPEAFGIDSAFLCMSLFGSCWWISVFARWLMSKVRARNMKIYGQIVRNGYHDMLCHLYSR